MDTGYIDELIFNDRYKEEIKFAKKQEELVNKNKCPICKEYSLISVPEEIFMCAKCGNLFYYDKKSKKMKK